MNASRARRAGLALVMAGALSVSVRGQVEAVWPLLGGMSIVLALTNDVAALLALNEVISTGQAGVRRWAWAVLLLAGGTTAGLNTWHALALGQLPPVWAVVVGAGPVGLSMLLSHLMALVLTPSPAPSPSAIAELPELGTPAVPVVVPAAAITPAAREEQAGETSRVEPVGTARPDPGNHPGPALPGPAPVLASPQPAAGPAVAGPVVTGPVDGRVARLVAVLDEGAELTGASAAVLLGCSERTGRRLLAHAHTHTAPLRGVG